MKYQISQIQNHFKLTLLALCVTMMGTPSVQAEPFWGGHMAGGNINRLLEATDLVVSADEAFSRGREFQAQAQLRVAYYRVRIVRATLNGYGLNQAKHALGVIEEKIMDRYLPTGQKIAIVIDCMGVAMTELVQNTVRSPIRAGSLLLQFVDKIANCNYFEVMNSVLYSTQRILNQAPFRDVREALSAIDVAIEKIRDPYLGPQQKSYLVKDCVGVALRSLRNCREPGGFPNQF